MSQILATIASVLYGVADFAGGLGTRRTRVWRVTVWGQVLSMPLLFTGVFVVGWDQVTAADIGYGVLAGLFGIVGAVTLYRALAAGTMSIVSPLTGTLTALIPVLWGLSAGEEIAGRQWVGIAVALAAIVLVARDRTRARLTLEVVVNGLVASVAFSGYYIALASTAEASGQWPLVANSLVGLTIGLGVLASLRDLAPPGRDALGVIAVAGNGTAAANLALLLALQSGPLGISVVLTSIYPAFTTIAAVIVLHERPTVAQRFGIVLALAAAALLVI